MAVERKSIKDRLKEKNLMETTKTKSQRRMASTLLEMVENEKITSDFDCGFIRNVVARLDKGLPLTEKQEEHLDKCFHERY
jgi:hypothetical protein